MIKRMDTQNMSFIRVSEESFQLSIHEKVITLNVDELEELRNLSSSFWDNNNLWHLTTRAKEEKVAYAAERLGAQVTPLGIAPIAP